MTNLQGFDIRKRKVPWGKNKFNNITSLLFMSLTTTFDLYIALQCKSFIASEPLGAKYKMDRIKTGTEDRHSDHSG
jgi:hypothetical protein